MLRISEHKKLPKNEECPETFRLPGYYEKMIDLSLLLFTRFIIVMLYE